MSQREREEKRRGFFGGFEKSVKVKREKAEKGAKEKRERKKGGESGERKREFPKRLSRDFFSLF